MHKRNIFLISALFLGLFADSYANSIKDYLIYVLSFMMSLSLQSISVKIFKPQLKILKPILTSILLNYFIFGLLLMLLVFLIIPYNRELYIGFFLIAVAPPGVVIVPFAVRMNADVNHAALGVVGAYLFLLLLFPLSMFFLNIDVHFSSVFHLIFFSVILPIFASRLFRLPFIFKHTKKYQSILIDVSFFVLIYVVIGINKSVLIDDFSVSFLPVVVLSIFMFPISLLILYFMRKFGFSKPVQINNLLMLMVKNNGFSAVSALTLFGSVASIPSAALSVVLLVFLLVLPYAFIDK